MQYSRDYRVDTIILDKCTSVKDFMAARKPIIYSKPTACWWI